MYEIFYTRQAEKQISGLPANVQMRIYQALDDLTQWPDVKHVRKLQGQDDEWRLRVGDYRVVFSVDEVEKEITVTQAGSRGSIY